MLRNVVSLRSEVPPLTEVLSRLKGSSFTTDAHTESCVVRLSETHPHYSEVVFNYHPGHVVMGKCTGFGAAVKFGVPNPAHQHAQQDAASCITDAHLESCIPRLSVAQLRVFEVALMYHLDMIVMRGRDGFGEFNGVGGLESTQENPQRDVACCTTDAYLKTCIIRFSEL